tara:strand:+ start:27614 stop:27889 length:276 start_codon:yes stop_codon:yes gene_type:complete
MSKKQNQVGWIERPSVRRGLLIALWLISAATVLAKFAAKSSHPPSDSEKSAYFYAILGFSACALMIFLSKGLGLWLKVKPDYYERGSSSND